MKQIALFIALSFLMACSPGGSDDKKALPESENTNPADINTLPVEIKKVVPEVFTRHFEVSGFMEAVKDAVLSPEINGQIQQVIVQRGARVKKGDLLIKLNTDLTEKSIDEVNINLSLATQIFERQKDLWEQNIGSELQYLEAKNAVESLEARLSTLQKQLEMAHITAPFSGIVDDIMVKEGELAVPGMQLLHLLDLSEMRISSRVSEAYLNNVQKGDLVDIRVDSYEDQLIRVPVSRLGEVIDQQTRTFILEVELKNPREIFKPNMLASVRIRDYEEKNALVVPSNALKQDFNGTFLFSVSTEEGSSKARKVYVETGITVQDQTIIKSGIAPDDMVITKGFNLVGDGTPVRVVNL